MKECILIFRLLFYLSVLLFFNSCRKDKPDNSNEISAQYGQLKDYIYFKKGSYWIYEDKNGAIDSMYVTDSQEGNQNGYDYLGTTVHSTYDTYDYFISWNTSWTSYHPTRHKVFMRKVKVGDYVGEIILMEYPPVVGNILYHYNDNDITTVSYFINYQIDSLSFNSVIKMHETHDITNYNLQATNYFIARNVGIIKEEMLDSNNVWKLRRFKILQ